MTDPGRHLLLHRAPEGLLAAAHQRRRQRRTVSRRVVALAAAFLLGVGVEGALSLMRAPPSPVPAPSPVVAVQAPEDLIPVRLVFHDAGAHTVAVAGTWNDWSIDRQPLHEARDGVFSVDLMLPRGRHEYMFVIDGVRWVADPSSPLVRADGFGQENAVLEI